MCCLLVVSPLVFQNKQNINVQQVKKVGKPPLVTLGQEGSCLIELFYIIPPIDHLWMLFSARDHLQERNKGLRHLETNSKAVIADLKTLAEWGMLEKFIIKNLFFESGRKTSNCYWQSGWLANKGGDKWWHQKMLQFATCYRLAGVVLTNETSFRQRGKMWLDLELMI